MVYNNKFVVAVKYKGKILREIGDTVYLPFGSEYSVLLKNKNSVKAVVNVEVDGEDVLDDNSIIVDANDTVELKGFMKGMSVRNRFRFIERTKKISSYRGNRIDDGLIKVDYRFEKPPVIYQDWPKMYRKSKDSFNGMHSLDGYGFRYTSCSNDTISCSLNDNGITVRGSEVQQNFVSGTTNTLESSSSVIVIQLKGRKKTSKKSIKKPVTVKTRVKCTSCGTRSKTVSKFCRECGTFLH